jgi:hypothetical protein
VVRPDIHFIPLKKDFSNVDEVLEKVQDDVYVRQMTERAYQDVIASGKYSYAGFIADFDQVVTECKIVAASTTFVNSLTATIREGSITLAGGVISPRYLPGKRIFSAVAETERRPRHPDMIQPDRGDATSAPSRSPIVTTGEILAAGGVLTVAGVSVAEIDVLGHIRTRTLLVQFLRRVWSKLPVSIRYLLRPAVTSVRVIARGVWK